MVFDKKLAKKMPPFLLHFLIKVAQKLCPTTGYFVKNSPRDFSDMSVHIDMYLFLHVVIGGLGAYN